MAYSRGSSDGYDRYARVTNDPVGPGRTFKIILKWCVTELSNICGIERKKTLQQERFTPPADLHNIIITGQFDPSVHGYDGITPVSLPGFPQATNDMVLKTTQQLPDEFPSNIDFNSGNPLGIGELYRSAIFSLVVG